MAADKANFREEITSIKNQHSSVKADTAYGFFDNVLVLQNASDVTKLKILPIIHQFRNPLFKRPLYEIIQPRAKRIVDFEFLQQGYALTQEIVESWSDVEYIDNLEKVYQNIHLEATTLSRVSKIKMGGLFVSGKISPLLIKFFTGSRGFDDCRGER